MIKVLFFARLREALDCDHLSLDASDATTTVKQLRQALLEQHEHWRDALDNDDILVAVNQQLADDDTAVADGDEVAFYPPVTGG